MSIFRDGPEYKKRLETPFRSTNVTMAELHSVVPKHLHKKDTVRSLSYVARDVIFAVTLYKLGWLIDPFAHSLVNDFGVSSTIGLAAKWSLWAFYWYWQGVVLTGWWTLAHEAGHCTLSPYNWVNHLIGFSMHTFILVPYFSWRSSHQAHHKATGSIERDENYVPRTRADYNLPPEASASLSDYHDLWDEAPIYSLGRILFMQALGWQFYLLTNALGSPQYPPGTNHFQPSSPLFKPHERKAVIVSNIGLAVMASLLFLWTWEVGVTNFLKLYFVPYVFCNHWIVMMTYLQHSDPAVPHFRNQQWSFISGALSTIDRPLLGWVGRFFLHNVSHNHVTHHLFSSIPFYNQPQVTEAVKNVLGENYNYDSTNTFRALYRSFTQCLFIEDEGDIVFYKNKDGQAQRVLAQDALENKIQKPVSKLDLDE